MVENASVNRYIFRAFPADHRHKRRHILRADHIRFRGLSFGLDRHTCHDGSGGSQCGDDRGRDKVSADDHPVEPSESGADRRRSVGGNTYARMVG